jgi:hypothetical protein
MIPLGYMAKRVMAGMEWLNASQVLQIYSVSSCISEDFGKWIDAWKHNGYWFFDSPQLINTAAAELKIDLSGTTFLYYEGYAQEYDPESGWAAYQPNPYFPVQVIPPEKKILRGFDVVTFSHDNSAECSPLSCNGLAAEMPVNEFCLLNSLEEAKALLEAGRFTHSEPGPYRILAVYAVDPV